MSRVARLAWTLVGAFLVAAAAGAQDVYIDYDRSAQLSSYKTFAIAEPGAEESLAQRTPTAHRHVIGALRKRLLAGGRLTETAAEPQVYVTYRIVSAEDATPNATDYELGPGWKGGYYWAGGGWGVATGTVETYPAGTLVVDIWDANSNRAVWRGVATSVLPERSEKGSKKIDAALDMLVEKWRIMRAQGK
jgi:hypothetical protein